MFNVKRYNYKGGGLLLPPGEEEHCPPLASSMNPRFKAPSYIDSRPYCISASNQGDEPSCAGFTQAGYAEVRNWRRTGEMKQFDGSLCYREAKKLDGLPRGSNGTSLYAAAQAAKKLGWLDEGALFRVVRTAEELRYALHMYGCLPVGFDSNENWNRVDTKTGYIARKSRAKALGGHAVLACYYDKDGVGWQNSWGTDWGRSGFGKMTWDQFDRQFLHGLVIEKPWLPWRG